jgi:glycosyltransferase involved in cell wall biosynthesis
VEGSLRVVFGVTSRSWGGNEKWAAEAARGLAARGHRVTVLWTHPSVLEELAARGLPSRRVRLWGDLNPVGFASLVRILRAERPDVVVLTKQREYWMGGLAARLSGRPLVVFRLGLRRSLVDDFKRRTAFGRLADLIIVNSKAVSEAVLTSPWVDPARVRILMNGVATDEIAPSSGRALMEALGAPAGAPVVCGAGRLTNQKGLDVLIAAFARVVRDVPEAWLVLLGEGGQREALEAEAECSGVRDHTIFAGHRDDVRIALSGADVYALSSRNEGMANTLLEAMSVGVPIVATDVSGTREAVEHGTHALVVPPEDPEALASSIVLLLRDKELGARLGAAARARAVEAFGLDRMAVELEGMLFAGLPAARRRART